MEKQEQKTKEKLQKPREQKQDYGGIVRIMQTDIPGEMQIYAGLTRIKGIGWSISNAICLKLKLNRRTKISLLKSEEIKRIEEFIQNMQLPTFLINRKKDLESGKDLHLITTDLDLRKEFDIKRLKKIKSYRGLRHATGQPTRGQRTRGHFRQKGKSMGVIKSKNKR